MIYGIGIDLVHVPRVAAAHARFGERFARKILSEHELEMFHLTKRPVKFLAMRFAAKEATSKALGTGFKRGVAPRLIEVTHNPAGKPSLGFHGAVADRVREEKITGSYVSLTDEQEYAMAYVVLER